MGEARNSELNGPAKMAVLVQLGKFTEGKQWDELTAAEQLVVNQEYDKVAMAVGTDQKAASEPTA